MQPANMSIRDTDSFLPDFCGTGAVATVLVMMQFVALLLTLAGRIGDPFMWQRLLLLSLYLHWIGLCSAMALCQARRWLSRMPVRRLMLFSYVLLIAVTGAISEMAWRMAQWLDLREFLADEQHAAFLLRNLCICGVVAILALRYFWLQQQWRQQLQAEAESRYQALQARIRPHFLFNSLNSIAALVATRPQQAETAVEDLAQLFRAGLHATNRHTSLHEELEVTRAYLRTEALRLGERLRVRWSVAPDVERLRVPSLCLQPLLENAVTHGLEALPEGGEIIVTIGTSGAGLSIEVDNPVPPIPRASDGAGLALDNIRQRLRLMYGEKAGLVTANHDGRFNARLLLPVMAAETQGETGTKLA